VSHCPGDISTTEGLIELVAELNQRESHLDVLVNNAGTAWAASFGQVPEVGWDKVMDLNVKSPFFLIQALTPLLQARASAEQTAAIINIGSIAWHGG
jgi:NAD(P)-dependent dehydrogenase (short-subunit alcohol dehydrogenase family)